MDEPRTTDEIASKLLREDCGVPATYVFRHCAAIQREISAPDTMNVYSRARCWPSGRSSLQKCRELGAYRRR